MTVCEFKKILLEVTTAVYHDEVNQEPGEYIRWSEVGESSLRAEGTAEIADMIAVDIFTQEEFSELPARLREQLDKNEISYADPEIKYDHESKYKQYSYTLEVP